MMKSLTFFALITLISISTSMAVENVSYGYLKSGGGFCSIRIEEQNDYYHQLTYATNDFSLRAVNLELKNKKFDHVTEHFEKEGNEYTQLLFPMSIFPRTYKISIKNLKNGQFKMTKTTLIFGNPVVTTKDVCITKHY